MSTVQVGIYFEPSKPGYQLKGIFVNHWKTKQRPGLGVGKGYWLSSHLLGMEYINTQTIFI